MSCPAPWAPRNLPRGAQSAEKAAEGSLKWPTSKTLNLGSDRGCRRRTRGSPQCQRGDHGPRNFRIGHQRHQRKGKDLGVIQCGDRRVRAPTAEQPRNARRSWMHHNTRRDDVDPSPLPRFRRDQQSFSGGQNQGAKIEIRYIIRRFAYQPQEPEEDIARDDTRVRSQCGPLRRSKSSSLDRRTTKKRSPKLDEP